MEMLIIAVVLFVVYMVWERFSPAVDEMVVISNNKATSIRQDQEVKLASKRAKMMTKLEDMDSFVTAKDLDKLLKGKIKLSEDTDTTTTTTTTED